MDSFGRFNPFRAFGDLRRFLAGRQRHEFVFLLVAFAVCATMVVVFVLGSQVEKAYQPPDIIYVQSWPANRSDADIIAQQKLDAIKDKKQAEAEAKFEAEKKASYKRLSDQLNSIGI